MNYAFLPPPQVSVPVAGGSLVFPVRRVYCVGRNYADHAAEMGADRREPPFFFSKPADALVPGGGEVAYPPATDNLQHEVELVVALACGGADIPPARALACVYGYAVGLDLTRRDLQQRAKDKGHPWDMGKGFDQSAPISAIQPVAAVGHPGQGRDLAQGQWTVAPERRPRADDVESRRGDRQPVDFCQARAPAT
jgi:fumarylpyruvate hydrolase